MNELRTLHLHGKLGKDFGRTHQLAIATAGEAIRAMCANHPSFLEEVRQGSYRLVRGDLDKGIDLDVGDVNTFKLGNAELHIVPQLEGAKTGSNTGKMIAGAVLIGAAVFFSGGALAAPLLGGLTTWGNIALLGGAMLLSGISSAKAGETKSTANDASFAFSGPGNIYEQGSPVPLVYGEVITGSVMISGGIDIEEIE